MKRIYFSFPVLKQTITVFSLVGLMVSFGVVTIQAKDLPCKRYAKESVRQNQQNQQLNAGFRPPVWSGVYNDHYNWCMAGNNVVSTPVHLANREKQLQEFVIKKKDKDMAAKRYATESVRQYKQSQTMAAGFRPPVWSADFNGHYNWSKHGGNISSTPRHLASREKELQEYAIKHNKGSAVLPPIPPIKGAEHSQDHISNAPAVNNKNQLRNLTSSGRLKRLETISKGSDPIVATFMHTLEKHLSGKTVFSDIEKVMLNGIRQLSVQRQKQVLTDWKKLPTQVRMNVIPENLRTHSPQSLIEMPDFVDALVKTAKANSMVKGNLLPSPITDARTILMNSINLGLVVANGPEINSFNPMGPDGPFLRIGQTFTLNGTNLGNDKLKTKIHFMQQEENGKYVHMATVYPATLTDTTLTASAIAPNLQASSNAATRIIVESDGKFSAPFSIILAEGLLPTPEIDLVEPGQQYPGNALLVTGKRINHPLTLYMKSLDSQAGSYRSKGASFNVTPMVLSNSQFQFTIPQDAWSGHYKFNIRAGNSGYSNFKTFQVVPPHFQLRYTTIHCLDESYPEWPGDDEIVTSWVVIADNQIWTKGTGEYAGFSDNTQKQYSNSDGLVLPPMQIKDFLYVRTSIYETDDSDIKAWTDGIQSVTTISKGAANLLGAIFGNPEAGKIAGEVIQALGDGLSKLIGWLGGGSHMIGSEAQTWTAPELQVKTSQGAMFNDKHIFKNGDDTGSYNIDYQVIRNQ